LLFIYALLLQDVLKSVLLPAEAKQQKEH